ncbi:lysoplasmalogenase [Flagellimonas aequoris]|uniref:Lysoplasmalogenase n=1 Tax=Flagellimonas aequoris TaxID=2306997 RepID=A0A418N5L2_9FLAO|nr:lysoplasmalogenase [Allomuricauda aequoris]RIV69547.1 lysoplasmalogenase [Allomuricauda aequoris]TXK01145.1 lysoplasmalogenase [Allomuricauda aequoris]
MWLRKNWVYGLLLVSCILAILGVTTSNFLYKSGTAGMGIIILMMLQFQKGKMFKDIWMIIAAFLFSIIGDWLLSNMNGDSMMFVKGIALFFLAHVGYLAYALMNGRIKWAFTGVVLAAYLIFFFVMLYPTFTDMVLMVASLIYLLISCFSLGASVGMGANGVVKWSYIFGIIMILFSDTIISFKEFMDYHTFDFLITPTYYLAHICITFSLMKRFEMQEESPKSVIS